MGQLNYGALSERLSKHDIRIRLAQLIFDVQGEELKRLDYKRAGAKLGISAKTVSRRCDELADLKVIIFSDDKLKLNPDLIAK